MLVLQVEALARLTHDNPFCVVVALLHARCLIRAYINGSNVCCPRNTHTLIAQNADYYQSAEARLRVLTDAIKVYLCAAASSKCLVLGCRGTGTSVLYP